MNKFFTIFLLLLNFNTSLFASVIPLNKEMSSVNILNQTSLFLDDKNRTIEIEDSGSGLLLEPGVGF